MDIVDSQLEPSDLVYRLEIPICDVTILISDKIKKIEM